MMTVKVEFSINTVDLEVKYLYNHLNAAAICLRTTATQFSATTSISTLEPITGCKSETAIPRNIDGSRIGKTIRRSRYKLKCTDVFDLTAFLYVYCAFTSLLIVVELCTLLRYEVIVLKCR